MELSKIAKITQVFLYFLLVIGGISLFFVRGFVRLMHIPNQNEYTFIIILIGLCCLYIVFEVIKVFQSISSGNPFISSNEKSLKKIACICEFITLILIIALFLFITTTTYILASIILIFVFGIAGLCCYVFSQLFKLSVFLKEENDMTI
ncbi:MAG: DUF2975 domain-containing protein [Lachnospirales bacterium]